MECAAYSAKYTGRMTRRMFFLWLATRVPFVPSSIAIVGKAIAGIAIAGQNTSSLGE